VQEDTVGGNLSGDGAETKQTVGLAGYEDPGRALLSIIRGRNTGEIKSRKRTKTGSSGQFADLKLIGERRQDSTNAERIIIRARGVDACVNFFVFHCRLRKK
jgi:hypothetical protein